MSIDPECWRDLRFPTRESGMFPNIVNVEVFRGACPCRCGHCPLGRTEPATRKERYGEAAIALDLYDKITAEVGRYRWAMVRIHSVGDPILWSRLPEALRIGARNNARSWIFTSAVTADETLLDLMCEHAAVVEISVNSTNPTDYARTKGVDAFEIVLENIRRMHRRAEGGASTRLVVSRVQSPDQAADEEFVRFWKSSELVDDAFVRAYHTYNDCLPGLFTTEAGRAHQPCLVHWARFNIDVSGRAIVCFNELFKPSLDPAMILGDVNDQSIAEIWRGPKLNALRRAELAGDFAGLPFADSLPCKDCSCCQPLFGRGQTSEYQIAQLSRQGALGLPGKAGLGPLTEAP